MMHGFAACCSINTTIGSVAILGRSQELKAGGSSGNNERGERWR